MNFKKILFLLLYLCSLTVSAQSDFNRQLHIQNLERQANFFIDQYNLNFNLVVLDISQAADEQVIGSVSLLKSNDNYFLASTYNKNSILDGKSNPACIIFINYKNNSMMIDHENVYKNLNMAEAKNFTNFYLIAHEVSHCIAQDRLPFKNNGDEKYADAITAFLIKKSQYSLYTDMWIKKLIDNDNDNVHNTFTYVSFIHNKYPNINSLEDVILSINQNPN